MCQVLIAEDNAVLRDTSYERLYTTLSRRISFLLRTRWRCIPRSAEGASLEVSLNRFGLSAGRLQEYVDDTIPINRGRGSVLFSRICSGGRQEIRNWIVGAKGQYKQKLFRSCLVGQSVLLRPAWCMNLRRGLWAKWS